MRQMILSLCIALSFCVPSGAFSPLIHLKNGHRLQTLTKPSLSLLRAESAISSHEVHWLDDKDAEMDEDVVLGEAIARGEAVVCIPNVASTDECNQLFAAGLAACERRGTPAARGRSRFSISDPEAFSSDVVMNCEEILLRVMDYIDENIPSIYETLFMPGEEWLMWQPLNAQLEQPEVPPEDYLADTCDGLRELYMMGELEWSEGEPAIK